MSVREPETELELSARSLREDNVWERERGDRKGNSQSVTHTQPLRKDGKEVALGEESPRLRCRSAEASARQGEQRPSGVCVGLQCQALESLPCSVVAFQGQAWSRLQSWGTASGDCHLTVSLEGRFESAPLWLQQSPNHFSPAL